MNDFKPSWDNLPGWLSAILIVLFFLKDHIKRGFDYLFRSSEDTREHRQELEEARLNSQLQDQATLRLHQYEIDNQAFNILRENLEWSRGEFSQMQHQIRNIQLGINRQNDLLTLHNKLVAELVDEVRELVKEIKKAPPE